MESAGSGKLEKFTVRNIIYTVRFDFFFTFCINSVLDLSKTLQNLNKRRLDTN